MRPRGPAVNSASSSCQSVSLTLAFTHPNRCLAGEEPAVWALVQLRGELGWHVGESAALCVQGERASLRGPVRRTLVSTVAAKACEPRMPPVLLVWWRNRTASP